MDGAVDERWNDSEERRERLESLAALIGGLQRSCEVMAQLVEVELASCVPAPA